MFSERLRYKYTECCWVLLIKDFFLSSAYIISHTHRSMEELRVGRDLFRSPCPPPLNSSRVNPEQAELRKTDLEFLKDQN